MPNVQVAGLDHVVLRCADNEASFAFYCAKLGLAPNRGLASSLYVHDPDGNTVELRSYPT